MEQESKKIKWEITVMINSDTKLLIQNQTTESKRITWRQLILFST